MMSICRWFSVPRAATLAVGVLLLCAGPAVAAGNLQAGAQKSQYCSTCHGPTGNYTHTGTPIPAHPDWPARARRPSPPC